MLSVAIALLYAYTSLPQNIIPGTCNFYSGISCTDIILSRNVLVVYLVNSQSFPINAPVFHASINGHSTALVSCVPDFILPGGSMSCTTSQLPADLDLNLGALANGHLYLNAAYCGLVSNYTSTGDCTSAPIMNYSGGFSAHSEQQPTILPYASNYIIYVIAPNTPVSHGNARIPFYTQVMFGNYPVVGATVSVSLSNSMFDIQPLATTTNITGSALGYIWGGNGPATVEITASLGDTAGTTSNTATITFT